MVLRACHPQSSLLCCQSACPGPPKTTSRGQEIDRQQNSKSARTGRWLRSLGIRALLLKFLGEQAGSGVLIASPACMIEKAGNGNDRETHSTLSPAPALGTFLQAMWSVERQRLSWASACVYLKSNSCEILLRAFSDPALQS